VLRREQTVEALLAARRAARTDAPTPGPLRVTVDNRLSDSHTVIEVKGQDRVGLLYVVTATLAAHDVNIASARIATEIDQAYDTFYVTDRQGRRIEEADAIERVRAALEHALAQPL
jgi:[protein-PII] uridylyltransferase